MTSHQQHYIVGNIKHLFFCRTIAKCTVPHCTGPKCVTSLFRFLHRKEHDTHPETLRYRSFLLSKSATSRYPLTFLSCISPSKAHIHLHVHIYLLQSQDIIKVEVAFITLYNKKCLSDLSMQFTLFSAYFISFTMSYPTGLINFHVSINFSFSAQHTYMHNLHFQQSISNTYASLFYISSKTHRLIAIS